MALDTLSTPIAHSLVTEYLDKLDERGETYEFLVTSADAPQRGKRGALGLVLHREGTDDPLTIKLHPDGTWTAEHLIIIGEQE